MLFRSIKELNNKPEEVRYYESMISEYESESALEEFQEAYQKEVEDAKDQLRGAFYGVEVGMLIIHLGILMMVRKRIADQAERKVLHAVVSPEEFVQNMEKEQKETENKKD